jgi:hypothetical protein
MAPYPPQQPPPGPPGYPPPYPPPMVPQAIFTPPPPNDGKAIASLVLGILSIVGCFGALAGIPAVILGFMSKRDIARSGGTLGGDGLALGGIITGIISTLLSVGMIIFYVAVISAAVASTPSYTPPAYTPYTPYTAYTVPTATATAPPGPTALKPMPYTGTLRVVDLKASGGSLRTQLALELGAAKDDSNKLLVMTASRKCHACDEVFDAFGNYQLQKALANVRVVRVDVDAFPSELAALGLDKPVQPWFYRFDDSVKVIDSISADEWDDNDAFNITPVLKSFMAGTYKKRATADGGVKKPKIQLSDPF